MTEKLKYKVGDKVLVEAEVTERYKGIGDLRDQIEGFDIKISSEIIMPKLKVTQAVMDWYESNKISHWGIRDYIAHTSEDIDRWIDNSLQNGCAFATLITYGPEAVEVEKEKKYKVKIKGTVQILAKHGSSLLFEIPNPYDKDGEKYSLTKQELIDAGFEGVFGNPMFEVEEVE